MLSPLLLTDPSLLSYLFGGVVMFVGVLLPLGYAAVTNRVISIGHHS